MQTEQQKKKRKRAAAVGACVLAAAIVLTGTYAWQSISQQAKNVAEVNSNPGGRLHDDFNGENKDVYVENFTEKENGGVPIYIRVRLDEYMEIGPNAGKLDKTAEEAADTPPLAAGADINDVTTWKPHIPGASADECAGGDSDTFHKYWGWDMGGETVFMPTFNKNKDSLKADINGTIEGLDGIKDQGTPYDDYTKYSVGDTKTGDAVYDADNNTVDEGDAAAEGTNITTVEETHTAKASQSAQVMTMAKWKAAGAPMGRYWVYDTDGWAYWAETLAPGEATGLLLDGINLNRVPDNKSYYGINVVGQFATRGDWGDAESKTGFYADDAGAPPTEDALFLLKQAADLLPKVTEISIAEGNTVYVKPGESITLHSKVKVVNGTGVPAEKEVNWSISPATNAFVGSTFTAPADMEGGIYQVTVTSAFKPAFSATTTIYVYPPDAIGVVKGQDSKMYVDYGDNTFKEILGNGLLGPFICAGKDKTIGNADDTARVVVIDPADATYGSKFIGEEYDYGYWAPGPDGLLGTADDIKVWGNPWPGSITTTQPVIADAVTVTAAGNKNSVKIDSTLQFSASVTLNGRAISRQNVTWSVIGAKKAGTKIDSNGLLTVDKNEAANTVLTIKATSLAAPGVSGQKTVTVSSVPPALDGIENITPGSINTITIDGIEWYVLAKDGNKALLWAKEMSTAWGKRPFGAQQWKSSAVKTWLNGDFLNSLSTMKNSVTETTLYTRTSYNANTWDETKDKVFLLSEADLFGLNSGYATSEAKDYTYKGTKLVTNAGMLSCTRGVTDASWLRNCRNYASQFGIAALKYDGGATSYSSTLNYGVRPALWVTFQ